MSPKLTLVLVPGAWHNISTWDKVASLIEEQQYNCVRVALPSTTSNPSTTFLEDIEAVRDAIVAETTQGRDVVVVVHSYGGAVGASAIKGLTRPKQIGSSSAKGPFGHIIGLVMLASGFGPTGVSFIEGLGGKPPPTWRSDPSGFAVITVDPRQLFYHDLPEEEGNYWVGKLEKQALRPMMDPEGGEHSYAGWMDVPVWFLATTEDKAFPVQAQKAMVQMAKDAGADVTLREVASSHSPMLSRPEETTKFILEAVKYFVR
jgi:pimeloyl-ACP methyl ester carboxylesterase